MSTLRRGSTLLLALLDAFVYDPLLDWSKDAAAVKERRRTDRRVSLALFSTRVLELRKGVVARVKAIRGSKSSGGGGGGGHGG